MINLNSGQLLTLEKTGKFTNALAYSGAIVYPEKYPNGLIIELSSATISNSVPLLYQHKPYDVVGLTEHTAVSNGIFASGQLANNNDLANEIKLSSDWQLSIGVQAETEAIPESPETVNGIEIKAPVTIWKNSTVKEISLTKAPHDTNTTIQFFAKTEENTMTEEEFNKEIEAKNAEIEALKAKIAEIEMSSKKELLSKTLESAGLKEAETKYSFMLKLSGDDFKAAIESIELAKKPALPTHMQQLSNDFQTQHSKSALIADAEKRGK